MDNELESLLIDVCQLIDGHGTVPHELTDWDKQVRQRISDYRASRVSRLLSDGAEKFIDFVLMQENAGVSITKGGRRKKAWIGGVESTDEDIVRFVENYIRAVR